MIKAKVFTVLECEDTSLIVKAIDYFLIGLILINILAVITSSFNGLPNRLIQALNYIELFSVIAFSAEYVLRLWIAPLKYQSRHPYIKHALSFMAIIDLLAILPFYLPLLIPFDLRFLRILRLFRLLRIFKLNRYNDAARIIGKVLAKEKEMLLTTIFMTSVLIIFASSIMYYVENDAQPEKFPNIVASIWWAVATLTTVGYGDVYPVTGLGKLLSGIISLLGIGLVALPTGIISSGFISLLSEKKKKHICPHCGKEII